MSDPAAQRARVQGVFGRESGYYVTSLPHARGDSLARAAELLEPRGGTLLDIATGAGHTALIMAPRCDRVIAADLTAGMLAQARRLAAERGAENLVFLRGDAENLPLREGSADYVTVRIAPHHFADVFESLREMLRVLKPGGRLLYVDNIAPEEPREARLYNDFERRRDPSHYRCESLPVLVEMMEQAGLKVLYTETLRKRMDFEAWARRPAVDEEIRARLLRFLREPGPAIRAWLAPREEEGRLIFDEVEGLLLAEKS